MSLNAKASKSDYENHPAGMFAARCYAVIDLGTHINPTYGKAQRKVKIVFETTEAMKDGRPFSISNRYTFSLADKALLRQHLESWRGQKFDDATLNAEGFDISKLIGKAAMINVTHNGDYANIVSVNPLPKGMMCPDLVNEPIIFDVEEFDEEIYGRLGKSDRETIARCIERGGTGIRPPANGAPAPVPAPAPRPVPKAAAPAPVPPPAPQVPEFNDDDIPF